MSKLKTILGDGTLVPIGFVMTLCGLVFAAANVNFNSSNNTNRITKLEESRDKLIEQVTQMNETLVEIKTLMKMNQQRSFRDRRRVEPD